MSKLSWYKRRVYKVNTELEAEAVRHAQRALGLKETGELDEATMSHLRGIQALFGLRPTGILDDGTAEQIERIWPDGA